MSLFRFEEDFAGSLRCIPMIARLKLDLAGIKLSLRQWSRLRREERAVLVEAACGTPAELDSYRIQLIHFISERADEPVRLLGPVSHADWQRPDAMPDAVRAQARRDGIAAPDPDAWARLTPLQRFALVKLARSEHENENFMPAMREFGLHSDPS